MRQLGDLTKIKVIVMDIDGVLTDGHIGYPSASGEIKFFNVLDGQRMKLVTRHGFRTCLLTGRNCAANDIRAKELDISYVVSGCKKKADGFAEILQAMNVTAKECMYIGDDIVDIPPMRRAGLGIAVANAVPELLPFCHYQTKASGGCGAVREAIEFLLKGQGKWDGIIQSYIEA